MNWLDEQYTFTQKETDDFRKMRFAEPNLIDVEGLVRIPVDRFHHTSQNEVVALCTSGTQLYLVPKTRYLFSVMEKEVDGEPTLLTSWQRYRKMDTYYNFHKNWIGKITFDKVNTKFTEVLNAAPSELAAELTFNMDLLSN